MHVVVMVVMMVAGQVFMGFKSIGWG